MLGWISWDDSPPPPPPPGLTGEALECNCLAISLETLLSQQFPKYYFPRATFGGRDSNVNVRCQLAWFYELKATLRSSGLNIAPGNRKLSG